ncbi:hypothetical protein HG15A2_36300 [Adhaeretor mobilis]|uniref:Uncharacterized protein n=1 Tax=Adhaeretor mobilis TaxID=1930276 RepID=A0A517MZL4_9BACT|nr:hypothetical protein HG15A2_36300 [Adhaeretor mobilis]
MPAAKAGGLGLRLRSQAEPVSLLSRPILQDCTAGDKFPLPESCRRVAYTFYPTFPPVTVVGRPPWAPDHLVILP